VSSHLYTPAYATRLGNLTAKSVVVRLCDQANDEGVLWTADVTIACDTEIGCRTVKRMIEVFATMGLVELKWVTVQDRHGSRKRREIHLNLTMLGKDLTEAFGAAYAEAQGKSTSEKLQAVDESDGEGLFSESVPTPQRRGPVAGDPGVAETSTSSVAEMREKVAETCGDVAETQKSVAETFPPDPLIGGTTNEPSLNHQRSPQRQRPVAGDPDQRAAAPEPENQTADELTPEQREDVDRMEAEHGRITAQSWRLYYLEENRKAAAAEAVRRADEAKDEELRREYGDEPEAALARMRKRCGFAWVKNGDLLAPVLRQVIVDQAEMGKPVWRTAAQMESAWLLQRKQGQRLRARYGPLAFYRDGHWLDPAGWHWNTELLARESAASVGSVQ
jgi:hypothetical protein